MLVESTTSDTYIGDECHSPGLDDVKPCLDLAKPLKVTAELSRVGIILPYQPSMRINLTNGDLARTRGNVQRHFAQTEFCRAVRVADETLRNGRPCRFEYDCGRVVGPGSCLGL